MSTRPGYDDDMIVFGERGDNPGYITLSSAGDVETAIADESSSKQPVLVNTDPASQRCREKTHLLVPILTCFDPGLSCPFH